MTKCYCESSLKILETQGPGQSKWGCFARAFPSSQGLLFAVFPSVLYPVSLHPEG